MAHECEFVVVGNEVVCKICNRTLLVASYVWETRHIASDNEKLRVAGDELMRLLGPGTSGSERIAIPKAIDAWQQLLGRDVAGPWDVTDILIAFHSGVIKVDEFFKRLREVKRNGS